MFDDHLAFQHRYYKNFFTSELAEEEKECSWLFIIGKECFLYEVVTGFNSLSAVPEIGTSSQLTLFTWGWGMKISLKKNGSMSEALQTSIQYTGCVYFKCYTQE